MPGFGLNPGNLGAAPAQLPAHAENRTSATSIPRINSMSVRAGPTADMSVELPAGAARKRQRTSEEEGKGEGESPTPLGGDVPSPHVALPPWHHHDDTDVSASASDTSTTAIAEGATNGGGGGTTHPSGPSSTIFVRHGKGYLVIAAPHGGDLSGDLPDRTSGCMEPG